MNHSATIRRLACSALFALLVAVAATVFGHIDVPGLNPLVETISDYAVSDRGGAIEVAMVALAIGSLALLAGLRMAGAAVRGLPTVLLTIWVLGLLVAAIVPTDPPGVTVLSTAANVHRYASVTGFVCLPIAVALLAVRWRRVTSLTRLCGWLRGLGVVCAIGLGLLWYVAFPGGRVLMGLVERGLLAVEITMLVLLASALLRLAKPATTAAASSARASLATVVVAAPRRRLPAGMTTAPVNAVYASPSHPASSRQERVYDRAA